MKKSFLLNLPIVVLVLVIFGCSDKVVQEPTYTPPPSSSAPPVTPPPNQKTLRVEAGIDQVIFLPLSGTNFKPYAIDFFKNLTNLKYEWKKTKGPDKYKMDDSTKFNPSLSNLEIGLYEFVFTATTPDGRFDMDTVNIQVVQPIGEFVILNMPWFCFSGGCGLDTKVRISKDKSVRIYIKPDGSVSNWIEVINLLPTDLPPYGVIYFRINNESLSISSVGDQDGNSDVKIVFQ